MSSLLLISSYYKGDGMYSAIIRYYNLILLLISGASFAHIVHGVILLCSGNFLVIFFSFL